jgi:anti-anti-sigma regulatory factor
LVVERAYDVLVVVLGHSIDSLCGADLLEERTALIDEVGDPDIRTVIFDFANVQYFDSLVLDTLCQVWKRLSATRKWPSAICRKWVPKSSECPGLTFFGVPTLLD